MKLRSTIRQVLNVPPSIAIAKFREKIVRSYKYTRERQYDKVTGSYSFNKSIKDLPNSYFASLPLDYLKQFSKELGTISENILEHKFDLLGSGLVQVRHGVEAEGFDGVKFDKLPDSNKLEVLQKLENINNIKQAAKIIDFIDNEYQMIDWQLDFRSGYRWKESQWYKDIRYGHIKGPDIKIPWELGRMQHLPFLAMKASLENRKEGKDSSQIFVNEFKNQIYDFIVSNPPRYGVQWMNAMDVGIRAVNWLVAYDILNQDGLIKDDKFIKLFSGVIYEHALHILWNMEWSSGMRGNHYFSNIVALLFISAYLPATPITKTWLAFAIQEFISEIDYQFNPDGSNFEASTAYHKFTAEMLFWGLYIIQSLNDEKLKGLTDYDIGLWPYEKLLKKDTKKFLQSKRENLVDESLIKKCSRIAFFLKNCMLKNGGLIKIGDEDNGKFLSLTPESDNDNYENTIPENSYRYKDPPERVLSIISGLLGVNEDKYDKFLEYNYSKKVSEENKKKYSELESGGESDILKFDDFGLYFINNAEYHISIRCGKIGQNGKGGHSHNDQLSLTLKLGNDLLLIDPGTYVYTADHNNRNLFRSTLMHNTLILENEEQNKWFSNTKDDLFWVIGDRTLSKVKELTNSIFIGEHYAWSKPHIRELTFGDNSIEGKDICEASGNKFVHFHLSPTAKIKDTIDKKIINVVFNNYSVSFLAESGELAIDNYFYSPEYGRKVKSKRIIIKDFNDIARWKISISKK